MKKGISILVAAMMLITMIGAVCGCGVDKAEADELFSGVLVDAQNSRVVVRGDTETMLFVTTENTSYELGEEPELCIGDQIEVSYHKGDDTFIADTVTLKVHEKQSLVFGGDVTELTDTYLTVQSDSLTAVFYYNQETKITGDLSKGDTITITYEGNISENPQAVSIVVIQEKKEAEKKSIHGTVSELGEKSVIISVDSAHAARFHLTPETTYSGDDTKLQLGDEVNMIYTGDVGEDPVAVSIKIKRKQQQKYYVVDGVIEKVSKKSIVVRTSKKAFTFGIAKETRIQNPEYMDVGHKTTITYVGELDKNPIAASIFCSKDTTNRKDIQPENKEKKQADESKAEEKKSEDKKSDQSAEPADSSSADDKDSKEPDQSAEPADTDEGSQPDESAEPSGQDDSQSGEEAQEPDQSAEPEAVSEEPPVLIKAKGLVVEWNNPFIIKVEGSGILKLDITDAKIAAGYIPELGDQVIISYDKDTLKLIEIQLEYRPVVEEETAEAAA